MAEDGKLVVGAEAVFPVAALAKDATTGSIAWVRQAAFKYVRVVNVRDPVHFAPPDAWGFTHVPRSAVAVDPHEGDLYFFPDKTARYLTSPNSLHLLWLLATRRVTLSAHAMDVYMHRALLWAYTLHENEPDAVMRAFADIDFQADTLREDFLGTF